MFIYDFERLENMKDKKKLEKISVNVRQTVPSKLDLSVKGKKSIVLKPINAQKPQPQVTRTVSLTPLVEKQTRVLSKSELNRFYKRGLTK